MAALAAGSFKGPRPAREPTNPGNPGAPEPAPAQHDGECAEGVMGDVIFSPPLPRTHAPYDMASDFSAACQVLLAQATRLPPVTRAAFNIVKW